MDLFNPRVAACCGRRAQSCRSTLHPSRARAHGWCTARTCTGPRLIASHWHRRAAPATRLRRARAACSLHFNACAPGGTCRLIGSVERGCVGVWGSGLHGVTASAQTSVAVLSLEREQQAPCVAGSSVHLNVHPRARDRDRLLCR